MQGTATGPMGLRKLIVFYDVEKVLRSSLSLDDDVKITPDTKLMDLNAEPIDILDIYHKLGMEFSKYTSGEKLNFDGRKLLLNMSRDYFRHNVYPLREPTNHFKNLAKSKTTNDFINQLLVKDLIEIKNYEII
tara:strand:- start:356 stop:754 length:399 start_codon:yes stop_codon:yes gene_type:complete